MRTPVQHLADLLLDERVEDWVATRRNRERPLSWRRIALELRDVTEGKVDVSPTTLLAWCSDAARKAS
jgi:hypothetical protein